MLTSPPMPGVAGPVLQAQPPLLPRLPGGSALYVRLGLHCVQQARPAGPASVLRLHQQARRQPLLSGPGSDILTFHSGKPGGVIYLNLSICLFKI